LHASPDGNDDHAPVGSSEKSPPRGGGVETVGRTVDAVVVGTVVELSMVVAVGAVVAGTVVVAGSAVVAVAAVSVLTVVLDTEPFGDLLLPVTLLSADALETASSASERPATQTNVLTYRKRSVRTDRVR